MAKGSAFEREIVKKLSLWWTYDQRNDIFWRTSGSGARATVRMKKSECTAFSAGDIGCIDPEGIPLLESCLIEIKRGYNKLDILSPLDKLVAQKTPLLFEWWIKAEKEREQHKRYFTLIIFKRDRKRRCIVFDDKTMAFLDRRNRIFKSKLKPTTNIIKIRYNLNRLNLLTLNDFLDWCKPDAFKDVRILKRRKK